MVPHSEVLLTRTGKVVLYRDFLGPCKLPLPIFNRRWGARQPIISLCGRAVPAAWPDCKSRQVHRLWLLGYNSVADLLGQGFLVQTVRGSGDFSRSFKKFKSGR